MKNYYDFDKIIERRCTDSLKYGLLKERFGREDLLPMWVADMDFATPPEIIDALLERVKHGIFGYSFASENYFNSIINWQKKHHNFEISANEISFIPGVVKGIAFVIEAFTKEGDGIIIQPPVYHPFKIIPTLHNRKIVNNPLIYNGLQYEMDFENLEKIAKTKNCKLLIISNPHNPGGRVWTKNELKKVAEICEKNNILVISDEIHSDLTLNGHIHTPFSTVSEEAAQISITLNAPSKTFNVAGFSTSYSIIKNYEIRNKFNKFLQKSELSDGTIFAYLVVILAYNYGEAWLEELKKYLWENVKFTDKFLKQNIPQIRAVIPEASFLVWLDCRELQLPQNELVKRFIENAKLALNDGKMFGEGGAGFMRLNVGCPQKTLETALERMKNI